MTGVQTCALPISAADHVGNRNRLRSDEPHRRADGRRHDLFNSFNAGRDSGHLCAGQAVAVEERVGVTFAIKGSFIANLFVR